MDINWQKLSVAQLEEMYEAAGMITETMRVLHKSNTNVVAELLRETESFLEWNHVPPGDIYDDESHSQYYYHAHPKSEEEAGIHDDEHGHFHTFMRGPGMPKDSAPKDVPDYNGDMELKDILTHIIGIGMDANATPIRFFTVNRWVTGEVWFDAADVIIMLERFEIDYVRPSWPVNLWLTNIIRLYKPLIKELILERDKTIEKWKADHPDVDNVYEDRNLEVTSAADLNLMAFVTRLENEIERRGLSDVA